jgi:hypothetical protein
MTDDFTNEMMDLMARYTRIAKEKPDPDLGAEMIECLASSIGTLIAILCSGDKRGIEDLLVSTDEYAHERASDVALLIQEMTRATRSAGGRPN